MRFPRVMSLYLRWECSLAFMLHTRWYIEAIAAAIILLGNGVTECLYSERRTWGARAILMCVEGTLVTLCVNGVSLLDQYWISVEQVGAWDWIRIRAEIALPLLIYLLVVSLRCAAMLGDAVSVAVDGKGPIRKN